MKQDLKAALQNPSMVLLSGGASPDTRPSLKKANGLLRLGAALMLGVALLSPLNALAAGQNQIHEAFQQTSEIVQASPEAISDQNHDQNIDWFKTEIDGRNWTNAPTEAGQVFHIPTWVKYGVVMDRAEAITKGLDPLSDLPRVELNDTRVRERIPSPSATTNQSTAEKQEQEKNFDTDFDAQQEMKDIAKAKNGPRFSLKKNRYNFFKKYDLAGKSFKDATPENQQDFIARLVQDAYIEMKAGHTTSNPSQNLINICQHVEDIAKDAQVPDTAKSTMVFEACQSGEMQSRMLLNTTMKGAAFAGVTLSLFVTKAAAIGALVVGASVLSGQSVLPQSLGVQSITAWRNKKNSDQTPTPKTPTMS